MKRFGLALLLVLAGSLARAQEKIVYKAGSEREPGIVSSQDDRTGFFAPSIRVWGFAVNSREVYRVNREGFTFAGTPFAELGSYSDGVIRFCSDCTATAPCAGGGSGALAIRMAGAWECGGGGVVVFTKAATLLSPAVGNFIVWRAPFACTVTNVRGYRVGGTGATINARLNGASNHLASALSLTSVDTWMDGGAVQNTAYAAGDKMEVMVVSVTGSPTQIAIQVEYTK